MANLFLIAFAAQPPGSRKAPVGEAHALGIAQDVGWNRLERMLFDFKLHVVNLFELIQEPRIDPGHFGKLLDGVALSNRVTEVRKPLGMRRDQTLRQNFGLDLFTTDALPGIERANTFHQRFFEGAADGHHFADGLHLRAEALISSRKFFKLPLGNFDDYVIERWLEAGRSSAGDVVGNFIKRIADGELGGDLCYRKPSRFRG